MQALSSGDFSKLSEFKRVLRITELRLDIALASPMREPVCPRRWLPRSRKHAYGFRACLSPRIESLDRPCSRDPPMASLHRAFPAAQHRCHKVFPVRVTGNSYAQDVPDHKRQGDIGKRAMQLADDRLLTLGALPFKGAPPSFGFLGVVGRRNDRAADRERSTAALTVGDDTSRDSPGEA